MELLSVICQGIQLSNNTLPVAESQSRINLVNGLCLSLTPDPPLLAPCGVPKG